MAEWKPGRCLVLNALVFGGLAMKIWGISMLAGMVWVAGIRLSAGAAPAEAQTGVETAEFYEIADTIRPGGAINIVTYSAPRAMKLAELGLREAGLRGGPVFRAGDEIRIFASRSKMNASPKARIWLNTRENAWWYHTGGQGSAESFELQAGEVMVILTRASTEPIAWKNPLR